MDELTAVDTFIGICVGSIVVLLLLAVLFILEVYP